MKMFLPSRRYLILGLIAATVLPQGLAAGEESAPSTKTHVLFMGADLSVARDKKLYRVEDVTGSEFKIRVNGEDVLVRTRQGAIGLHVDADLKLSGLSVTLDKLEAGPGYTYGNDPMRKLEEANRNNMLTADAQDTATAGVAHAEANLTAARDIAARPGGYATPEEAQRAIAAAESGVTKANQMVDYSTISFGADSSSLGAGANQMALAKGNFDAMEVSFKISSPVELNQAYMVILFKFHDPDAKPGDDGLVIHAQALDPIDAKPRYIRVLQGGLPKGFKFVDCSVHIYNHGKELATNCSDKRVELTSDEARVYLALQHRGQHKGETLPAAAVRGLLLREKLQGLTTDKRTRTFYAKVAKDGIVQGIFADTDCKISLEDTGIKAVMGEVLFTPALEAGKPVDGVARVRLADL